MTHVPAARRPNRPNEPCAVTVTPRSSPPSGRPAPRPRCCATLFLAGVDMFRLNFSHGTHDDHAKVHAAIRALEQEVGRPDRHPAGPAGPQDPRRHYQGRQDRGRAPARASASCSDGERRRPGWRSRCRIPRSSQAILPGAAAADRRWPGAVRVTGRWRGRVDRGRGRRRRRDLATARASTCPAPCSTCRR